MYPSQLEVILRNNRWLWVLVEKAFSWLNRISNPRGILLNYSVVKLDHTGRNSSNNHDFAKAAILIQGPILFPKFLNSAIDFYRGSYPDLPIILSTWKNEVNLKHLRNLDFIKLIENEPPLKVGIANINYQVKSVFSGIDYAESIGIEYILKIRSDQGLFASNFLYQFKHALAFAPDSGQERIVTTDFNSFLFRLNSPSDQIQFAATKTLSNFWSAYRMDTEQDGGFPEAILLTAYLKSIGCKAPISLEESLKIYRDHFVFLDSSDLGLVWRKGSWRHPDSRFEQLDSSSQLRFVSPDEWRRLHTDLKSVLKEAKDLGVSNA